MIAALAERRVGIANEGDYRRTARLGEFEGIDALLGRPRKRRDDDDRLRSEVPRAAEHQFRRKRRVGREDGARNKQLGGGLHEERGTAGAKKEDVLRSTLDEPRYCDIDRLRKARRTSLDTKKILIEIYHVGNVPPIINAALTRSKDGGASSHCRPRLQSCSSDAPLTVAPLPYSVSGR